MKHITLIVVAFLLVSCGTEQEGPRMVRDFNFDWRFSKGTHSEAFRPGFDDSGWEEVRLPHDWSISEVFVNDIAADDPALLPGGIGWYRKMFSMPAGSEEKVTWIEFDGIYNNSDVWINGHHLGNRPYGYAPFSYDLTPHLLHGGQENVITVRVDRTSFQDSRWYSGSGIYRNVKLVTVSEIHIPQWGVFITTPEIGEKHAVVNAMAEVSNAGTDVREVTLVTTILGPEGKEVAEAESLLRLEPGVKTTTNQAVNITDPRLWDTEHPHMYAAIQHIVEQDEVVDEISTPFGIRHFRYDPETGFYLNGEPTPFKGVCLHHDGGSVGAAVPIGIWERRLRILREAGCNAIRTAHNPPAQDFLDLCDRMGFLVQDEAFDEFHNPKDKRNNYKELKAEDVTRGYAVQFEEWAEEDVKAMVKRDRNHPCVVQWSIGNEIEWTYGRYGNSTGYWGQANDVNYYYDEPPYSIGKMKELFHGAEPDRYPLAATAQKLADWIREEDPTRPVTANLVIPSVSFFSGYADALDIVGLSYRNIVYDYIHKHYPEKMIFGTENWGSWHEWKPVVEREFIPGIFLWTGINYLGETSAGGRRGSGSGLLDFAGFEKPRYHMFRSLWKEDAHIFMNTVKLDHSDFRWDEESGKVEYKEEDGWKYYKWGWQPFNYHWNYQEGDSVVVEIFTNQPQVELFLNGKSLGSRFLEDADDRILKWLVPFEAGMLTAMAKPGKNNCEFSLYTAGEAAGVELTADKDVMKADAYDVVHLTATLLDSEGRPVQHQDEDIKFHVEGNCRVLGTDNGSNVSRKDYTSRSLSTWNGRCLMILQAGKEPGRISVHVTGKGIGSETVEITMK